MCPSGGWSASSPARRPDPPDGPRNGHVHPWVTGVSGGRDGVGLLPLPCWSEPVTRGLPRVAGPRYPRVAQRCRVAGWGRHYVLTIGPLNWCLFVLFNCRCAGMPSPSIAPAARR
jgi:hypothetical protein